MLRCCCAVVVVVVVVVVLLLLLLMCCDVVLLCVVVLMLLLCCCDVVMLCCCVPHNHTSMIHSVALQLYRYNTGLTVGMYPVGMYVGSSDSVAARLYATPSVGALTIAVGLNSYPV